MSFVTKTTQPQNIDLDSSQTLENKTLDSSNIVDGATVQNASIQTPTRADVKQDTQSNLETYATTASNGQLCFATDTKKMYQVVDNALTEVGSGSGEINYIPNPDLEVNLNGYTGSTNLVITRDTSAPLRGTASLKITKGNANAAGEYVAIPFTIDTADLASMLTIEIDYVAEGTKYADGDIKIVVVKDPSGTPVEMQVINKDLIKGRGLHIAQFQTDATELDYELRLEQVNTAVSGTDFLMDNFRVYKKSLTVGPMVTDWEDYVPSTFVGLGVPTNVDFQYRRDGSDLLIKGNFNTGTVTGDTVGISIPDGLKMEDYGNNPVIGKATVQTSSPSATGTWRQSETLIGVLSSAYVGLVGTNLNSGSLSSITARVPIQGWSSNSRMSEVYGNREIRVEAAGNGGQSITASVTDIPFIASVDTTASWSGDSFTAPESGTYSIDGSLRFTSSISSVVNIYIDGVLLKSAGFTNVASAIRPFNFSVYLQKGQELSFRSDVSATLLNNTFYHHISITKLANPQTMFAGDTIAASYGSNSGQSVASAGVVIFEDLEFDTHNSYDTSTGEYIVPVSGIYQVNSQVSPSTNTDIALSIYVNGLDKVQSYKITSDTGTVEVSRILKLEKGDILTIRNTSGASRGITADSRRNKFSIAKIN